MNVCVCFVMGRSRASTFDLSYRLSLLSGGGKKCIVRCDKPSVKFTTCENVPYYSKLNK